MKLCQTVSFGFRPLTEGDAGLLDRLSVKNEKNRPMLGTGFEENKKLANAFAKNREIYPLASVITKGKKDVGIIILTDAGKKAIDVSLMLLNEEESVHYGTIYEEVLKETISECRLNGIGKIFFAPTEKFDFGCKFADATVTKIGTDEFQEFQFVL